MQFMSGCVRAFVPSCVCRIWRSPAVTHYHSINETGASMIYFKAVELQMDKIYARMELFNKAGFYAILFDLLI